MKADTPYEVLFGGPDGVVADMAREVENAVFYEAFGNTPDMMREEYTPYDAQSTFVAVRERRTGKPVSAGRLIVEGPSGLKTLVDLGKEPWYATPDEVLANTGRTIRAHELADAATIATLPEHRGVVSLALFQSLYQILARTPRRYLVAIEDSKVQRNMARMLPGSFRPIPNMAEADYLGAYSVPVWVDLEETATTLREKAPPMHAMMIEGRGLEDLVGAPDWAAGAAVLSR